MLRYKLEIFKGETFVKGCVQEVQSYSKINEITFAICNMGHLWSVDVYPCNDKSLKAQEDFMESHCINKI